MGNPADIRTKTVAQDFDDAYGDLTVLECSPMVTASSKRIATRYRDESGATAWKVQTIYTNASGEVFAIRTDAPTTVAPTWVPSGLL